MPVIIYGDGTVSEGLNAEKHEGALLSELAKLTGATFTGNVLVDGGGNMKTLAVERTNPDELVGRLFVTSGQNVRLERLINGSPSGRITVKSNDLEVYDGSADHYIAEYGSNSNGEYVRLYNGFQVCWQSYSFSGDINTGVSGSEYVSATQTWTFPASFSSTPQGANAHMMKGSALWDGYAKVQGRSASDFSFRLVGDSQTGVSVDVPLIAVGRWK